MSAVKAILLLLSVFNAYSAAANQSDGRELDELVNLFMPKNARVEALRAYDPTAKTESTHSAALFGRLASSQAKYVAFIYHNTDEQVDQRHLVLRIVLNPRGNATVFDRKLLGSFLWMQNNRTNGFQILDMNGDGNDEIVTISSEGGTLGAYVNVFAVTLKGIKPILKPSEGYTVAGGYTFDFERTKNGIVRIVIYGKWTEKQSSTVEVYEWDGKEYVKSSRGFPQYHWARLQRLREQVVSIEPVPASWRVELARQAVQIYLSQRKHRAAISLCEEVLGIIDNPQLAILVPSSVAKKAATAEEEKSTHAWWEINKIEAKAEMYHLLAGAYRSSGDFRRERKNLEKSQALEAEAKQKEARLPH